MILTKCAVCATDLGLSLGKKCGRCSTRYCGPACQKKHWEEGGHDQLCKKIKKAGGAEQFHANTKYTEAVAVAAEKCADDTKGQTCYICTQALHWKTKEGLVRGCSCRGTAGFVHVSCLAEQAKILVAEALDNNLMGSGERWVRWHTCSECKQNYHGVVVCALGWACWKTYLGRPEGDGVQLIAMTQLGNGLSMARQHQAALSVREAELSMRRRLGLSSAHVLATQSNLAITYHALGRLDEALRMRRDVYSGLSELYGEEHGDTLRAANNYAFSLRDLSRFEEARSLLRRTVPVARRVRGESDALTLSMRSNYARVLCYDPTATLGDLSEAVTTLEEIEQIARRVLGSDHPITTGIVYHLQALLRAREAPSPRGGA